MSFLDRTGIKYGKLTAKQYLGKSKWLCKCECGNEVIVYGGHLSNGHTKSCGCLPKPPRINIENQKFGKLTVIKWVGNGKWLCQCDCGNQIEVKTGNLTNGNTKSCGCLQKQRASESNLKTLIGQKFGRLEVKKLIKKENDNLIYYECQCDCGNKVIVTANNLRSGNSQSCGCLRKECTISRNTIDLTGQRFGNLVVLEKTDKRSCSSIIWKCKCDCGNIKEINGSSLRQGYTRSCGCASISHGEEKIKEILDKNNIPYLYNIGYFSDLIINKHKGRYDFVLYPNSDNIRLIEFDGEQHYKYRKDNKWYNSKEDWEKIKKSDKIKNNYAVSHNIPLVRIPYWEIKNITLDMLLEDKYLINNKEEM